MWGVMMYLTHLLMVVRGTIVLENHCVGLNMSYLKHGSQLLYENAGTKEQFSAWLDLLKSNHKQKSKQLIHGEKAEIIYHAVDETDTTLSFAEKVVAKGIKKLTELKNFKEDRTILRGIMFELDTQLWSYFMYQDGSNMKINELEMPNTIQHTLF